MIVTVQGTNKSSNHAGELVAALSVLGYAMEQKKTLILQFTDKTDDSVENILMGQTLRNESLVSDTTIPDVSIGMDPLVAKTRGYDKRTFSETTKALVTTKKSNLFDIAYVSRKESFEEEFLNREYDEVHKKEDNPGIIENILIAAKEAYDIVYIVIPSDNRALAVKILEFADVSIVCVRQGRAEKFTRLEKPKYRQYIVGADFDFGSSYNSKVMAKIYNVPVIFGLMHNVAFKDAVVDGNVLGWVNKNRNCGKTDTAYDFIHNIELLYNTVVENKNKKKVDFSDDELSKIEKPTGLVRTWQPINNEAMISVTKTGFFKTKTDEHITLMPIMHERKRADFEPEVEAEDQEPSDNETVE